MFHFAAIQPEEDKPRKASRAEILRAFGMAGKSMTLEKEGGD